jgi:hypothetical protein
MSQISQWYWRIPELGSRALRLRRQYVLALMVGTGASSPGRRFYSSLRGGLRRIWFARFC